MRPYLVCALTLLAAAPASAPAAGLDTGGTAAPSAQGGSSYAQLFPRTRPVRPVAAEFSVAPGVLEAGNTVTFVYRIEAHVRTVRVRIELTAAGAASPAKRVRLGLRRTGRRYTHVWTPRRGELTPGDYAVTLQAVDPAGRSLRRTARASGRGRLIVTVPPPAGGTGAGVFPIAGAYSFGGADARFGAPRKGHVHQGQDITAAAGTPLVAPVAGSVYWVAYQKAGAGYYVVERGADGRDYVFMHLQAGSITVTKGTPLTAGQAFGKVGATGEAQGPHLHLEIWPQGWYSSATSSPIDPLPALLAWAATR
jgi:murein DD-endopeptidase MepM/ murein hydrolase activator NlpD